MRISDWSSDVCSSDLPGRLALIHVDQDGQARNYSFGDMHESSNRLANLFLALGAKPGDRIGLLLPQAPETAYAHIAAYTIGCIAIPLFTLFGAEALRYRLGVSRSEKRRVGKGWVRTG